MMNILFRRRTIFIVVVLVVVAGLLIPQTFVNPVEGAAKSSYNQQSFWYYPWGKSGTHKGIDIFAKSGTPVRASTSGLVLYTGDISRGGNVVLVLGPKWRMHYYAHLESIDVGTFSLIRHGTTIGSVGTTGNAKGKPPHLHYSIVTLLPHVWKMDLEREGWKKMFYLDPTPLLNRATS